MSNIDKQSSKSFLQLIMRRLLIFLQPVKILNIPPKVMFILSFKCLYIFLLIRILVCVRTENHSVAILNDSFTCHKNLECSVVCVVDSQLVTVQLECAVTAVVHEHCWLAQCAIYHAIFKFFQKQNFCLLLQFNCCVLAIYNLVRTDWVVWLCNDPWFIFQPWKTWNGQRLVTFVFFFIFLDFGLIFFHPKVFSPSWELKPFSGLKLLFQLDHLIVELFELFFIKLAIEGHKNIVDFKVVLLELVVGLLEVLKGSLLGFVLGEEVLELWSNELGYIFVFTWKFFGWKACLREDCFWMTPNFFSFRSVALGFCLYITMIYFALRDRLQRSSFSTRCSLTGG